MSCDQIQKNMHSVYVCQFKQFVKVLIGTISRSYLFIITNIVPGIFKGRIKTGINPDRITAEVFDIIQFFDYTVDISDSISIRIIEGLGIDLIENSIIQPL